MACRFPAYLSQQGMIPGIKVDTGVRSPWPASPSETVTEGLDGLRERFAEYYKLGARFAKWRAVIDIGAGIPTRYAILANADALARYAALSQEAGIAPIVEPEVLMDGDHSLEPLRGGDQCSGLRQASSTTFSTARVRAARACCSSPIWWWPARKVPSEGISRAGGGRRRCAL